MASSRQLINYNWRFYFKIVDDTYRMEEIRLHPK
jgi:hypothetical protein